MPSARKNYYDLLGVSKTASVDEIKRSYKKLARQYHPDLNPNNKEAEQKFKEISEAYAVLNDADKRKKYDQFGSGSFGADFDRAWQQSHSRGGGYNFEHMNDFGFDLGDILGDIFGGGGGSFARGSARGRRQEVPQDLEVEVPLSFMEAVNGARRSVSANGSVIDVQIPKGVSTGSRVRAAGKGSNGGDLYLVCRVEAHPFFQRVGDNIEVSIPISLREALLGAAIEVPTISGQVDLKIPAGSSSGQKLKLKGRGIENLKSKQKGDQIVTLQVQMPKLTAKAKKELEEVVTQIPEDPSIRARFQI